MQIKRSKLMIAVIIIVGIIASLETMYIISEYNNKSIINPYLVQVLAHRKIAEPQSGHDVYEDLETIGCSVKQLETYPHPYDLYMTDYSAFLILAEGKEVILSQVFSFSWEPFTLYWKEDIALYADTSYGVNKWEATYSTYELISGDTRREISKKGILRPIEIVAQGRLFDTINHRIGKGDAELLGYYFLADLGYSVGKSRSTTLEMREPNYYWHEVGGLEKPGIQGERECWVYKSYFPADSPIRVLEIWVDRETGIIIGGDKVSA